MALVPGLLGLLVSRRIFGDLLAQSPHDQLAFGDIAKEGRLDVDHLFLIVYLINLTILN